jgi:predicted ferric reductase
VLDAVGRVTGLEGTYAVLVAVLLLARVWWLERLIGMDRLLWWHRWVGQASVCLLTAHALFIIWGYSVGFRVGIVSETRSVVLDLPDMLSATVALGIFIGVAVVSVRRVRSHLRYQTWYFIHLYVYIAVALSFAHQFATGIDFAPHLVNRVIWGAMYVVVFTLLVWYRLVVPLRSSWRHQLRVADVRSEAEGTVSVYLSGERLSEMRAQAGQFFIWRFLTRDGWWQAHPFSLSAVPDGSTLRLTIKSSGDFTSAIAALAPGSRVIAEGPFGSFTSSRRRSRKVLLVAAGAGIAPVRALFESLAGEPGTVTLVYRTSNAASLALRAELDDIAESRSARVLYLVGSRRDHADLMEPDGLRRIVGDDLDRYDAYVCGPRGFADGVRRAVHAAGVPLRRIHIERFEM